MRDEVVVGVDGSDDAVAALRWAADFAEHYGCPLRVTHAWSPGAWGTSSRSVSDAVGVLADAVERAGIPASRVHASAMEGRPGAALVRLSADARLLVVGVSGVNEPGLLPTTWIGTVARYVTRHAVCPVTVVGERHTAVVPEQAAYAESPVDLPRLVRAEQ